MRLPIRLVKLARHPAPASCNHFSVFEGALCIILLMLSFPVVFFDAKVLYARRSGSLRAAARGGDAAVEANNGVFRARNISAAFEHNTISSQESDERSEELDPFLIEKELLNDKAWFPSLSNANAGEADLCGEGAAARLASSYYGEARLNRTSPRSAAAAPGASDVVDIAASLAAVRKLNYIILGAHAGPIAAVAYTLRQQLGVPADQINLHCWRNYCPLFEPLYKNLTSHYGDAAKNHAAALVKAWGEKWRAQACDTDVAVCDLPAATCAELAPWADAHRVTLVARFSHRYWHHVCAVPHLRAWSALLRRLAASPRHIVAANNPFDAAVTRYNLGFNALPWATTGAHALFGDADAGSLWAPQRSARDGRWLVGFSVINDPTAFPPQWRELAAALRRAPPRAWRLRPRDERLEWGFASRLAGDALLVALPYGTHTTLLNEAYRRGIPLLLPERVLLAAQMAAGKYNMQHAFVGGRGFYKYPAVDLDALAAARGNDARRCPALRAPLADARNAAHVAQWLAAADYYNWPGVFFFNGSSGAALAARIGELVEDEAALRRASAAALAFCARVERRVTGVVAHYLARSTAAWHDESLDET